jgi:3-dehydroquinate dehydratase/shikimate dehydrogenase
LHANKAPEEGQGNGGNGFTGLILRGTSRLLPKMPRKAQGESIFGDGASRICGVVATASAREMARRVRAALRETRTIELRLDWLESRAARVAFLKWLRKAGLSATFIATCRTKGGGGRFEGSAAAELETLAEAVRSGCSWCDVESQTLRAVGSERVRRSLAPARILVSIHDFRRTPRSFGSFLRTGRRFSGAGTKIAVQAGTIADTLRVLRLARRRSDVVAVPMGEIGLPGRILALREGSALAYAPVEEATAPGQIPLYELKHLYRAHRLNRRTRVYGVIGDPVAHSLSPLLHNTGFIERRLDAVYLPFRVKELRDFLKAVAELGICGFSVTLPHKRAILRYLDECEPLAAEIGAVNTVVVRHNGTLYGCNTDYVGVLRALESRLLLAGSRVLVYGAGGSARAAAFALARAGSCVAVCARRENRARQLARAIGGTVLPRRALRREYFDAILNTTPVGMHPRAGISPLSAAELHCRVVMDFVYRPERTELLKIAARRGCETVSGAEMFLSQGFAQWEIWTEKRAPEAAMRRAVLRALREEKLSVGARGPG